VTIMICCIVLAVIRAPWLILLFGITFYLTGALILIMMLYQFIQSVQAGNLPRLNIYPDSFPPLAVQKQIVQPRILYHGTPLDNAFEIVRTRLWLIGNSQEPRAIWMTTDFENAKDYAGEGGTIVIIKVYPDIRLTSTERGGSGVYYYEIPDAEPYKEYYFIPSLTPIGILDQRENLIFGQRK
jgi:hypothetical protein